MNVETVKGLTSALSNMYGEIEVVNNTNKNLKLKIKQAGKHINIETNGLISKIKAENGINLPPLTTERFEWILLEQNITHVALALFTDLYTEVGNLSPNFENQLVLRKGGTYYFICKHIVNNYTMVTFLFKSTGTDLQNAKNWRLVGSDNVQVRRGTNELSLSDIQANKNAYQLVYRKGYILV